MDALEVRGNKEFMDEYMGIDTLDPLTLMLIKERYILIQQTNQTERHNDQENRNHRSNRRNR